jgi:hypothetical protein
MNLTRIWAEAYQNRKPSRYERSRVGEKRKLTHPRRRIQAAGGGSMWRVLMVWIAVGALAAKGWAQQPLRAALTQSERLELHGELNRCRQPYQRATVPELLRELAAYLDPESLDGIARQVGPDGTGPVDRNDLELLAGYIQFIRCHRIPVHDMAVECRLEKSKFYLLTSLDRSLLGDTSGIRLTWTHDDKWASERFIDKPNGPSYLLGQFMGSSKFASLADIPRDATKEQVLDLLGLRGYPQFENAPRLFLVRATANAVIRPLALPSVVVSYKWLENGHWRMADHFIENSIPGYTSGGLAEVVFRTFELPAENLADLARKGVDVFFVNGH